MIPKVSVVVPNYNHGAYLNQRIDSILNQTYQDFELIILDDCSTDSSWQVIEQYRQHTKVSNIVFNETNGGTTFKQWKKGIELAKGDYIWIAESDDWCEVNLLETLVQGLDDNKHCVLAYAQTYTVTTDQAVIKRSFHNKIFEYVNGRQYITGYLAGSCAIWNASMVLFKKENYVNVSPDFTMFRMCGDWLFYIEMAKQGDVFISGRLLNYFRTHDQDVSSKMYGTGNNYLEEIKILKILKKDSLISLFDFKKHLLFKYVQFTVFRYKFTEAINKEIENSFYLDEGKSFKAFLNVNGKLNLLKIKAKRRLNLLLRLSDIN